MSFTLIHNVNILAKYKINIFIFKLGEESRYWVNKIMWTSSLDLSHNAHHIVCVNFILPEKIHTYTLWSIQLLVGKTSVTYHIS